MTVPRSWTVGRAGALILAAAAIAAAIVALWPQGPGEPSSAPVGFACPRRSRLRPSRDLARRRARVTDRPRHLPCRRPWDRGRRLCRRLLRDRRRLRRNLRRLRRRSAHPSRSLSSTVLRGDDPLTDGEFDERLALIAAARQARLCVKPADVVAHGLCGEPDPRRDRRVRRRDRMAVVAFQGGTGRGPFPAVLPTCYAFCPVWTMSTRS